jgi:hypothetical protein
MASRPVALDPFRDLYIYALHHFKIDTWFLHDDYISESYFPDSWFYPEDVDDVYVDYNFDC